MIYAHPKAGTVEHASKALDNQRCNLGGASKRRCVGASRATYCLPQSVHERPILRLTPCSDLIPECPEWHVGVKCPIVPCGAGEAMLEGHADDWHSCEASACIVLDAAAELDETFMSDDVSFSTTMSGKPVLRAQSPQAEPMSPYW